MMNTRNKHIFLSGFFSFLCFENAVAVNFSDAVTQMLKHNGQYQAKVREYKAAKANVWSQRGKLLPSVSFNASYGYVDEFTRPFKQRFSSENPSASSNSSDDPLAINSLNLSGVSLPREGEYETGQLAIDVEQVVFDAKRTTALWRAKSQRKEAYYELLEEREKLVLRLVDAYSGYLNEVESIRITGKEINALKKHLDLTKKRYSEGIGALTDVYEAESRYQLVRADFVQINFDKNRFYNELSILLDGEFIIDYRVTKEFVAQPKSDLKIGHPDGLATNNVLLAHQRVKSAKFNRKNARAEHWPTVSIVGKSEYVEEEFSLVSNADENHRNQVMVQLTMPLFSGFSQYANSRNAYHNYKAVKAEAKNDINQAMYNFKTASQNFDNAYQRLELLKQAYQSSKKALELRRQGFLEGLSNNLDLLDSVRDSFRAERSYQRAIYDYVQSYFEFIASFREIDIRDIDYFNNILLPLDDRLVNRN